jgi:hypothetical protein
MYNQINLQVRFKKPSTQPALGVRRRAELGGARRERGA